MEFRFGLSGNKRRLLDSDSTLDGSLKSVDGSLADTEDTGPRIKDGAYLVFEKWVHCEEPVILTEMSSGKYGFQVRAIDTAGNIGEATPISVFTVDDTLPIPGSDDESDSESDLAIPLEVSLVIAGLGVVFAVVMCMVVVLWRRRSRRRRAVKMNRRNRGQSGTDVETQTSRVDEVLATSRDPILDAAIQVWSLDCGAN